MSFVNSIFLFATAAAVLPVLFHLVRRMRAKTVPFSSLMFLKATPKELVRKRRLKDRLLMAARAALLLLLALVFARPYLPAERIPFVPQRESESVVVLMDRSFSMRYDGAFERARAAARARMDGAAPGDELSLIAFDDEVDVLSQLESDRTVHAGALDAVEVGYGSTDFFPALQRAEDVLQEARHDRRVVVLITDFQEAGWTGALDNWKLPTGTVFEPVDVGAAGADNVYVEAFELSKRSSTEGEAIRFDARVAAFGDAAGGARTASLVLDGVEVDRNPLPDRPSVPVSFQQYVNREGYFQGSVQLDGDRLPDDNRYYFTDRMDGLPRVLVVDAPAASSRPASFYLRNAFDLGEASRFDFATADQLTNAALRGTDVVFVSRGLTEGERARLRAFVEEGGTVVISAGEASDEGSLTGTLSAFDMGRVETVVDAREALGYDVIIGEVVSRHPVFEPFEGGGRAVILRPQFRRFARLTPAEGTIVVSRFDSGDPFMAERGLGRGRVLFVASTLNTSWTDLPLDEMYVPLLYQIVRYATSASNEVDTYFVGDSVPIEGEPAETAEIRAPEGDLFRVTLDAEGRGYFQETDVPGHYAAAIGSETRYFSVNIPPEESDLTRRDVEEVYAAVVPPSSDAPGTPEQAAAQTVEDDERSQKLWRVLLAVVLVLFLVESYFANRRMSRRTEGGPERRARGRGTTGSSLQGRPTGSAGQAAVPG